MGISNIEHKVVFQKWSILLGKARKKRTAARKAAVGTGGGPEPATLDSLSVDPVCCRGKCRPDIQS
jgi:hypothetical protein